MKAVIGIVIFGASALGAAYALANGEFAGERQQVTLQDLRDKCESYLKDPQIKPQTVDLVCDQTRIEWRACNASFGLQNTLQIRGEIGVKAWSAQADQTVQQPQKYGCSTFVKHQIYTLPVSESLSCDDVLSKYNSDADVIAECGRLIKTNTDQNPTIVQDKALEESFNTCTGEYAQAQPDTKCEATAPVPSQQAGQQAGKPPQAGQQGGQQASQPPQAGQQGGQQASQPPQAGQQGGQQASQPPQAGQQGHAISGVGADTDAVGRF